MHDIVVATATFCKTESAYDRDVGLPLSLATVRATTAAGLPIIVVDGSPDPEVGRVLKNAGAEVIRQIGTGFGPATRQVIAAGGNLLKTGGVVLWQEPQKEDLVPYHRKIAAPILDGRAALVVPARSYISWPTYPCEQWHQEVFCNRYVEIVTGGRVPFDLFFGPTAFREDTLELVAEFDGNAWDARLVPIIRAIKRGAAVESVSVDYRHPRLQRLAEEGDVGWCKKRLRQLNVNLDVIEREWTTV